ncbi:hypothetical protein SEA_BEE17_11 [Microbacterium phage Bee17]|nr:hypothetical protein SEA_BEE17_11 [Microbacterium phage Bee17]
MPEPIEEPTEGDTVVIVEGDTVEANETPDPPVETGDNVVIVEESNDAPVEVVIDHAERIAILEAELTALRGETFEASMTADDALSVALEVAEDSAEADEAIVQAVDETVEDIEEQVNDELVEDSGILSDPDDSEPVIDVAPTSARVHPLFRSFSQWKEGN